MTSATDEHESPVRAWPEQAPPQPPLAGLREGVEGRRIRGALRARLFGSPQEEVRFGPYRLDDRLGHGATGTVYRATHDDGHTHAVKILDLEGPLARARFRREVDAASALRHPNIVSVHGHGQVGDRWSLAMDLVRGPTLTDWLAEDRSLASVLEVVTSVGRGLSYAHSRGVIHRDVKPDNILVGPGPLARLSDFGLVRALRGPDAGDVTGLTASLTQTGASLGTAGYMAPEQLLGAEVSAATDQFALAATTHLALFGRPAFEGPTAELVSLAILEGKMRPRPELARKHPELDEAVARALHPEPAERFPTVDAFIAALCNPRRRRTIWSRLFGRRTNSPTEKKTTSR